MMAVYKTLRLDKPYIPLFEGQYDVRIITACLKKMLGVQTFSRNSLPPVNPLTLPRTVDTVLEFANGIPKMKEYYPEGTENT
jgi:hypothetical protein